MLVPGFQTGLGVTLAIGLIGLHIGLLGLAVQVLREQIQNGIDALLRIMLSMPLELLSILAQEFFESHRPDYLLIHIPHLIHQFNIRQC